MKKFGLLIFLLGLFLSANSQKYITKNGYIGFFSHTPVEDIKADNNQVASVLDIATGDVVFQVLVKSFHFEKALMEEHFNENYMESEKYPKSTFTGKITNLKAIDFTKEGTYEALVEGDITIHGVSQKISTKGSMEVVKGSINATTKFSLVPEDFNITIPGVVRNNIAKTLDLTVISKYAPLDNTKTAAK